jgi:hypothetical protein
MAMIGKNIWLRDINRRKYRQDENGRSYCGPIERYHWVPYEVVGETRVSWLLQYGRKVPKKGKLFGVAFSEEEVDQFCYVAENRYAISEQVRQLEYEKLKHVADIIGYVAEQI